jgi:hypothetical protein
MNLLIDGATLKGTLAVGDIGCHRDFERSRASIPRDLGRVALAELGQIVMRFSAFGNDYVADALETG